MKLSSAHSGQGVRNEGSGAPWPVLRKLRPTQRPNSMSHGIPDR